MAKLAKHKPFRKKNSVWLCRFNILKYSKIPPYLVVILLIGFGVFGYNTLKYSHASPGDYNIVSDNFERPILGSNWNVNLGNVGIVNQSDIGLTAESGVGIASWVGSSPPADQYSEAIISTSIANNMLTQVFTRRRTSDSARYAFHYNKGPNVVTPMWEIKYDGVPTAQTRVLASSTSAAPSPGDVLRLEVRGSNPVELKGYQNGILILSITDSATTAIVSGQPGLTFRLVIGGTTTYPSPVFENWSGGGLSAATTPTSGSFNLSSSQQSSTAPSLPATANPESTQPSSPTYRANGVAQNKGTTNGVQQKSSGNNPMLELATPQTQNKYTIIAIIFGVFLVATTTATILIRYHKTRL